MYNAELPRGKPILVELEARFRSTIWIKRGSYVLVDNGTLAERDNKIDGQIVNVVRDEKAWRKMPYWYVRSILCYAWRVYLERECTVVLIQSRPKEFAKKAVHETDSEDEESTVGKMPPSESDDE